MFHPRVQDAKFDILKLIAVSDSETFSVDRLVIKNLLFSNMSRRFSIPVEAVSTGTNVRLSLNIISENLLKQELQVASAWRTVFNIENLLTACYELSRDLLAHEQRFLRTLRSERTEVLQETLATVAAANKPESPAVLLGRYKGYLGNTVGLLLKEQKPVLFEKVRVLIGRTQKVKTYSNNFPKSRKFFTDSRRNLQAPPGWCQLTREKQEHSTGQLRTPGFAVAQQKNKVAVGGVIDEAVLYKEFIADLINKKIKMSNEKQLKPAFLRWRKENNK